MFIVLFDADVDVIVACHTSSFVAIAGLADRRFDIQQAVFDKGCGHVTVVFKVHDEAEGAIGTIVILFGRAFMLFLGSPVNAIGTSRMSRYAGDCLPIR